jgi:hypothetical protein
LGPARASEEPSSSSTAPSDTLPDDPNVDLRTSYWGPIEPPSDSNTREFHDGGGPGWAPVVDFPVSLALLPVWLVLEGTAELVGAASESRTLRRLIHLFPIEIGLYTTLGVDYSTNDGFGGNASVDVANFLIEDGRLKMRLAAATGGQGKATLGVIYPRTRTSWVQVGAGYRSDVNARFYGFGSGDKERESFYREEMAWIGASYKRMIAATDFSWELGAHYSGVSANGTEDSDDPQLSEEFAQEFASGIIPGYRDRSEGPTFSLELAHDDTIQRDRPETGGIRRARVSRFQGKSVDESELWTYRVELQQFVPLWFSNRALALRGVYSIMDDVGNRPAAFQRLLTNDDPDLFRGYKDYRFRDRGIWAASAEYRWPVWNVREAHGVGLDAYAFVDVGQIFHRSSDFSDDVTTSYGGGLRLGGHGRFVGRLEVGHSEEETILRIRADQIFQYEKAGLLHGRNPVPER